MKKAIAVLLSLIIVCSAFFMLLTFSAHAESLYIRKIVSVVYDDSGSMINPMVDQFGNKYTNNNWAYASYAMQAFCGMLNSEDKLFITYMEPSYGNPFYQPEEMDLSAGKIQDSVDSIRQHYGDSGTPFSAVDKAYNKLTEIKDPNPNTEYWLVIITDGDFDFIQDLSNGKEKTEKLDEKLEEYIGTKMPNGSMLQTTFLAIGDYVAKPTPNPDKGLYLESAANADGITEEMSKLADRISGRTRLDASDITKIDDKTLQVSSKIPLLNIAVLAQNTDAVVTKAMYSSEAEIPVSRKANLYKEGYDGVVLRGGTTLIGDSQKVIRAETYHITFDKKVDPDDIVVMFEPALEMRVVVSVNGKEIKSKDELKDAKIGDKISAECKIFEMGTDKEIEASKLPSGTEFDITLTKNGDAVYRGGDIGDMRMTDVDIDEEADYKLEAAVTIKGFNPIEYKADFHPAPPPVRYSLSADYLNSVKSIKMNELASNSELQLAFTVLADGEPVTDTAEVKALHPDISVSPQSNTGEISYSDDGKIIFTPKTVGGYQKGDDSFDVTVTCRLDAEDNPEASLTYTVLISDYQVVPVDAEDTIVKTEFLNNQIGASFYITKDGKRLSKADVEKGVSVSLNQPYEEYQYKTEISADGLITVTPYIEDEHELTFWNWWVNWAYYFALPGDDVVITLNHPYGNADAKIGVVGESVQYVLLNVALPLTIELILLTILGIWLYLVITKARYTPNATLYVGTIRFNEMEGSHIIKNFSAVKLAKFNRIKRGNGRLEYKKAARIVSANGIRIRADYGGRIICEMSFPWYVSKISPVDTDIVLKTPLEVAEYIRKKKRLEIQEFATTETVDGNHAKALAASNQRDPKYFVVPDSGGVKVVNERKVIRSGKIFIYTN